MKLKTLNKKSNYFNKNKIPGLALIVAIIMPLIAGCHSLRNAPPTSNSEGQAIWAGHKGEQPLEVWPQRDWIICDRTIYRCTQI